MYPDEKLLKILKHDKEKGARLLVEQYSPLIHSVCADKLQSPEDIQECVNDTFAEFFLNFERYDNSKSSLKNYLCTIARHKSIDRFRKNYRKSKLEDALIQKHKENSVTKMNQNRDLERLDEAMKELSPVDQQILKMHYYDDLSYKEISEELQMNYETVKKRGLRGKKKLLYLILLLALVLAITACTSIIMKKHGLLPTWFPFYEYIPGNAVEKATPDTTGRAYDITPYSNPDFISSLNIKTDDSSVNGTSDGNDTQDSSGDKYQFSRQRGLIRSDKPAYELVKNTQKFTKGYITYELSSAFYQDGQWDIIFELHCLDPDLVKEKREAIAKAPEKVLESLNLYFTSPYYLINEEFSFDVTFE